MMFPLCTGGAQNSILFGIYGYEVRRLQSAYDDGPTRKDQRRKHAFIAGSIAGLIHSFIACPLELIKIRLQTQNCKTFCFLPRESLMCMYMYYFNAYSAYFKYVLIELCLTAFHLFIFVLIHCQNCSGTKLINKCRLC